MNIASVSIFKPNVFKILKPSQQQLFRGGLETKSDIFVRQNPKPLREHYSRALEKFTKEASQYIMTAPKITYDGLYEIIEKYSSDVELKKFKAKISPNNKSVAQYNRVLSYSLDKTGINEHIESQAIYISIPANPDKKARAELLGSFLHEAVHMFQYEARDCVFGESYIKKFYKNVKTVEEARKVGKAIYHLNYGFSKFEQNVFTLEENFLNNCFIDSYANIKNFDKFLKYVHGVDLTEIVKILIEDTYYKTGDGIINTLGENAIVDYVKHKLSSEIEAYEAENEVIQKYSPDSFRKMNSRFTTEVYKEILNIVNQLKAEKIDN